MTETESSSGVSRRTFVASVMGAIGAAGVVAAVPSTARAATLVTPRAGGMEYFLRATGVTGSSLVSAYRDWVNVADLSWGTLGRAPEPLIFTARSARHTATLFGKAFDGRPIERVEVVGRSVTQGQASELVRITLTNAVVGQVSTESGDDWPVETWTMPSYATAKLETRYANSQGVLSAWESMTWNVATGVVS